MSVLGLLGISRYAWWTNSPNSVQHLLHFFLNILHSSVFLVSGFENNSNHSYHIAAHSSDLTFRCGSLYIRNLSELCALDYITIYTIPVPYNTRHNESICYHVWYEYNSANYRNMIIISWSSSIAKTSKCVFPYAPYMCHPCAFLSVVIKCILPCMYPATIMAMVVNITTTNDITKHVGLSLFIYQFGKWYA